MPRREANGLSGGAKRGVVKHIVLYDLLLSRAKKKRFSLGNQSTLVSCQGVYPRREGSGKRRSARVIGRAAREGRGNRRGTASARLEMTYYTERHFEGCANPSNMKHLLVLLTRRLPVARVPRHPSSSRTACAEEPSQHCRGRDSLAPRLRSCFRRSLMPCSAPYAH